MNWSLVPLGEVLQPISRPEPVDPEKEYRLLGAHWYAKGLYVKDVKPGSEIRASAAYRVEEGDFVYNRLFAWMGSFAVAGKEVHGCYVSNEFPCFRVNYERALGRYLWLYFSRQSAWSEALELSSGGTPTSRNRLKEEKLLGISIPLPPVEEQRRIVARVDAIASRVSEARQLREAVTGEASAVMKSATSQFIGHEPTEKWVPLNTYVRRIENGWSPSCEARRAEGNEWGVLKVGAVSFGTYDPTENKALPQTLEPVREYEVRAGDFLMSRANNAELTGACAVVERTPPRLLLSDKHFRFHFHEGKQIERRYLDLVLKSPALRQQIERGASGTSPTMKNISKEKVLALLIPHRDLPEQRRIVTHLDALQAKLDAVRGEQSASAAELDALLPSVLNRAFAGEL